MYISVLEIQQKMLYNKIDLDYIVYFSINAAQ